MREKSSAYDTATCRLLPLGLFLHHALSRQSYVGGARSEDRLDRADVRSAGSSTLPIPTERNGSTILLSAAARFLLGEGSAMMDRGWTRPRGDRTEELR